LKPLEADGRGGIMVLGAACDVCCVVHEVYLCVLHVLFGVVHEVTLVNFFE